MSVGDRISELRNEKNLSQNQLAKLMEVSRQAVSKWETGQSVPDSLNLIKLADILETDIEYLTTGRQVVPTRPPVVIKTVETVEVEKVVEKPVIQVVEKIVEKEVNVPVEVPVVKKIFRTKYIRNPIEYAIIGAVAFLLGLIVGIIL